MDDLSEDNKASYMRFEVKACRVALYLFGIVYCGFTYLYLGSSIGAPILMFFGVILYGIGRDMNIRSTKRIGIINMALSLLLLLIGLVSH